MYNYNSCILCCLAWLVEYNIFFLANEGIGCSVHQDVGGQGRKFGAKNRHVEDPGTPKRRQEASNASQDARRSLQVLMTRFALKGRFLRKVIFDTCFNVLQI